MRTLGIVVSGNSVTLVECTIGADVVVESDATWALQKGVRPDAYAAMFERLKSHIQERKIDEVLIKGSALSTGSTKLAHLESAELRGVAQAAAAAAGATVKTPTKATISRTHGKRKVDEYIADDDYWSENIKGELRKGSREAAILIVAAHAKK